MFVTVHNLRPAMKDCAFRALRSPAKCHVQVLHQVVEKQQLATGSLVLGLQLVNLAFNKESTSLL